MIVQHFQPRNATEAVYVASQRFSFSHAQLSTAVRSSILLHQYRIYDVQMCRPFPRGMLTLRPSVSNAEDRSIYRMSSKALISLTVS